MCCLKLHIIEEEFLQEGSSSTPLKHNIAFDKNDSKHCISYDIGCGESYRYSFQGQEKDDEISGTGNSYTAEFWQYDPRLGRRWNVDPKYKQWESPYTCFGDNPIMLIDPKGDNASTHTDEDGNVIAVYVDGDLGIYKHEAGTTKEDVENAHSAENTSAGGEHMGWTLYNKSFAIGKSWEAVGKIEFNSYEARDWLNERTNEIKQSIIRNGSKQARNQYALHAGNNGFYDFKSKNGKGFYAGSQISENVYLSARDVGNYLAGKVAKMTNQTKLDFMLTAGAFEMHKNNLVDLRLHLNKYKQEALAKGYPTYGEKHRSNYFQRLGYEEIETIYQFTKRYQSIWED
jgi:RHS repeat-associated protein